MLTRYLARAVVALVTLVGGIVVAAAPAQAHWEQCPAGSFCIWVDWDGNGRFAYFNENGSSDLRNPIGGFVFDNKTTSIWNRGDSSWCVYYGYDYTSINERFGIGVRANLSSAWNDVISSLRRC
jgi:hypothetical protein